eukprot:m.259747 g.259747  ORF g.259747 m.259747 type:complete len:418 (-) comp17589_c0_seq6:3892-5145(-)
MALPERIEPLVDALKATLSAQGVTDLYKLDRVLLEYDRELVRRDRELADKSQELVAKDRELLAKDRELADKLATKDKELSSAYSSQRAAVRAELQAIASLSTCSNRFDQLYAALSKAMNDQLSLTNSINFIPQSRAAYAKEAEERVDKAVLNQDVSVFFGSFKTDLTFASQDNRVLCNDQVVSSLWSDSEKEATLQKAAQGDISTLLNSKPENTIYWDFSIHNKATLDSFKPDGHARLAGAKDSIHTANVLQMAVLVELKSPSALELEESRGQVYQYCQRLFTFDPTRSFIYAILTDLRHFRVFKVTPDIGSGQIKSIQRSGWLKWCTRTTEQPLCGLDVMWHMTTMSHQDLGMRSFTSELSRFTVNKSLGHGHIASVYRVWHEQGDDTVLKVASVKDRHGRAQTRKITCFNTNARY